MDTSADKAKESGHLTTGFFSENNFSLLKCLVCSVAVGWIFGLFTPAKPSLLLFGNFKNHRYEFRSPVRSVAKRLVGTPATGTPEIGSWFKIYLRRYFCGDVWFFHEENFMFGLFLFDKLKAPGSWLLAASR